MLKTMSITVKGKVQGVNYRSASRRKAEELGITGQVKNLPNGDVHIIATGTEMSLQEFFNWCKEGPMLAEVNEVITDPLPLQTFSRFSILH